MTRAHGGSTARRLALAVAALAVVGLLVGGCSGTGDGDSASSGDDAEGSGGEAMDLGAAGA